jgi:hypothetical protein
VESDALLRMFVRHCYISWLITRLTVASGAVAHIGNRPRVHALDAGFGEDPNPRQLGEYRRTPGGRVDSRVEEQKNGFTRIYFQIHSKFIAFCFDVEDSDRQRDKVRTWAQETPQIKIKLVAKLMRLKSSI